jgi:hypothetical protein
LREMERRIHVRAVVHDGYEMTGQHAVHGVRRDSTDLYVLQSGKDWRVVAKRVTQLKENEPAARITRSPRQRCCPVYVLR